eukprot:RCo046859
MAFHGSSTRERQPRFALPELLLGFPLYPLQLLDTIVQMPLLLEGVHCHLFVRSTVFHITRLDCCTAPSWVVLKKKETESVRTEPAKQNQPSHLFWELLGA